MDRPLRFIYGIPFIAGIALEALTRTPDRSLPLISLILFNWPWLHCASGTKTEGKEETRAERRKGLVERLQEQKLSPGRSFRLGKRRE